MRSKRTAGNVSSSSHNSRVTGELCIWYCKSVSINNGRWHPELPLKMLKRRHHHKFICFPKNSQPGLRRIFKNTQFELQKEYLRYLLMTGRKIARFCNWDMQEPQVMFLFLRWLSGNIKPSLPSRASTSPSATWKVCTGQIWSTFLMVEMLTKHFTQQKCFSEYLKVNHNYLVLTIHIGHKGL